ncbi:MAG: hypothetical protein WAN26_14315 [Steroidobacteraceae bacterium]
MSDVKLRDLARDIVHGMQLPYPAPVQQYAALGPVGFEFREKSPVFSV